MKISWLMVFFVALVASSALAQVQEDIHVTIQETDSDGKIVTGTFNYNFTISENADCSSPAYENFTQLTTDKNGIVSYYIEDVGGVDWSDQMYLGQYREHVLQNCTQVAYVPVSFFARNTSSSGLIVDSNITSVFDVVARMFYGRYDWVVGTSSIPYLNFNGTTLDLNETKLNNTIDSRSSANSSFNQTFADTRYWPYATTVGQHNLDMDAFGFLGLDFLRFELATTGIEIGDANTITDRTDQIAIGRSAFTDSISSVAIGDGAFANGIGALAIGDGANATCGQFCAAIGDGAKATVIESFAFGSNSIATASSSTAIGGSAAAINTSCTAVGAGTTCAGFEGIALGTGSHSDGRNTIAVGKGASTNTANTTVIGNDFTYNIPNTFAVNNLFAQFQKLNASNLTVNDEEVCLASNGLCGGTANFTNVAYLNNTQTFTGNNTFNGTVLFNNALTQTHTDKLAGNFLPIDDININRDWTGVQVNQPVIDITVDDNRNITGTSGTIMTLFKFLWDGNDFENSGTGVEHPVGFQVGFTGTPEMGNNNQFFGLFCLGGDCGSNSNTLKPVYRNSVQRTLTASGVRVDQILTPEARGTADLNMTYTGFDFAVNSPTWFPDTIFAGADNAIIRGFSFTPTFSTFPAFAPGEFSSVGFYYNPTFTDFGNNYAGWIEDADDWVFDNDGSKVSFGEDQDVNVTFLSDDTLGLEGNVNATGEVCDGTGNCISDAGGIEHYISIQATGTGNNVPEPANPFSDLNYTGYGFHSFSDSGTIDYNQTLGLFTVPEDDEYEIAVSWDGSVANNYAFGRANIVVNGIVNASGLGTAFVSTGTEETAGSVSAILSLNAGDNITIGLLGHSGSASCPCSFDIGEFNGISIKNI